ncbi:MULTISPECIES: biotin-dependent carboxyltransferase family protein [unclassified Rhodococcus (in: high G+C Gram-positive bacteria)]|uniref:5-oxoprolinase subunit C family protein n=1 Tax=unclassified Rhodococcus (in: high G+C Gram-positive bacteria) TaxID=192944 RepID=UPI0007BC3F2C|nr:MULTISPECIES: biotin-dependent carboxyltransferase family protein [unclassified Rhodococcus (in: high G+C Gram-positive bacteria)]KZE99616.1 allophanate hydrolase [Rhodococcus sp. EPR-147]KZF00658.1 allophanate hydrolase [Rhodococcus sp. EPR-279]OZE28960.1 allophanate hydrolase [Rhodococcus sp. 05-2254-6]
MRALTVLQTGPLCTVQDRGRPGHASIGVGRSGAADLLSHDAANRLVGNTSEAATLEVTFGGLKVRAEFDAIVAVTGAHVVCRVDGAEQGLYSTILLRAGQELELSTPTSGLRSYLAVRGGIGVPTVLGSRSTDTMSGLGPAVVSPGTALPVGNDKAEWPAAEFVPPPAWPDTLRITFGPRADWFTARARSILLEQSWTVTQDSDRVGIRLDGAEPLRRTRDDELASEGMVLGALQVPPSGQPVLFLADHPVTGGYPVIAVVTAADVSAAAQLTPGTQIHFRAIG